MKSSALLTDLNTLMDIERTLTLDSLRIRYLEAGPRSAPRVLLVHGGSVDSASLSWRYAIPALASDFHVVAPDMPGFGRSEKPALDYSSDDHVEFLHRFASKLGWDTFCLAGLSMGGMISTGFALRYPEQVPALVLVDSAGLSQDVSWGEAIRFALRFPSLHDFLIKVVASTRAGLRAGMTRYVCHCETIDAELVEDVFQAVHRPLAGTGWRGFLRREIGSSGFKNAYLDRITAIEAKTLLIHGIFDNLIPLSHSQMARTLIPHARLETLSCGHWVPRERPAEFNRILLEFLSETAVNGTEGVADSPNAG